MKRISVRAVRQTLIGRGNLRTLLSDRIADLDPYKPKVDQVFKKIYSEEAFKGWSQIKQLFDGIPAVYALENTWAVIAKSSELTAFLLKGVEQDVDKAIKARARKLFKQTNAELTGDPPKFEISEIPIPDILELDGFSEEIRVRWGLALRVKSKPTYLELLKSACLVESLDVRRVSGLLREAFNYCESRTTQKISESDAIVLSDLEMEAISFDTDLFQEVYADIKIDVTYTLNLIQKLRIKYQNDTLRLKRVFQEINQKKWQIAGQIAEKFEVDKATKLASRDFFNEHNLTDSTITPRDVSAWTSMSSKGYANLAEILPEGLLRDHLQFSATKIAKYVVSNLLDSKDLNYFDVLQLNKIWSSATLQKLINAGKFGLVATNQVIWKEQPIKTILMGADTRDDADDFLSAHMGNIENSSEILKCIISINSINVSNLLKKHVTSKLTRFGAPKDGLKNWNQFIAKEIGTKLWSDAANRGLINAPTIDQILFCAEKNFANSHLKTFKNETARVLTSLTDTSYSDAKRLLRWIENDPSCVEFIGPNLNENFLGKISSLLKADISITALQSLYPATKEAFKESLWRMQIDNVKTASHLIELCNQSVEKDFKLDWNHRFMQVTGSVEERSRALVLISRNDHARLKKIRVGFSEEAFRNALLWSAGQLPASWTFDIISLELLAYLGLRQGSTLKWLIRHRDHRAQSGTKFDHLYTNYQIPKKSGKMRTISAPASGLKRIQKSICVSLLDELGAHECAFGFVKGKSIVGNAQPHIGKEVVVNADVSNCFPSVRWPLVHAALKRDLSEKLSARSISFLVDVCTAKGVLPIGAPTSPSLLNRVLYKTDEILLHQATSKDCAYSRYADDLTFSGDSRAIGLLGVAKGVLIKIGLELDSKKTNIFRRGRRQMCTGLVVNDKVNVPRRIRKKIRASVHAYEQGKELYWDGESVSDSALRGRLEFLKMVSISTTQNLQNRFDLAIQKRLTKKYQQRAKKTEPKEQ